MAGKRMCGFLAGVVAMALCTGGVEAQVQAKTVRIGSNCTASVIALTITNGECAVENALGGLDIKALVQAFGGGSNGVSVSVSISTNIHLVSGVMTGLTAAAGGVNLDLQKLLGNIMVSLGHGGAADTAADAGVEPVTWLGVATECVTEDLRAQLPLPAEVGLVVRNVSPGSPAEKAGLLLHDVLVRVDDQLLLNDDQLRKLVRSRKEGDEIMLTVLRKGKELQVKAGLGTREMSAAERAGQRVIDLGTFNLDLGKLMGRLDGCSNPVVIHKVFSGGGTTNLQRLVDEALRDAEKQIKQQVDGMKQKAAAGKVGSL